MRQAARMHDCETTKYQQDVGLKMAAATPVRREFSLSGRVPRHVSNRRSASPTRQSGPRRVRKGAPGSWLSENTYATTNLEQKYPGLLTAETAAQLLRGSQLLASAQRQDAAPVLTTAASASYEGRTIKPETRARRTPGPRRSHPVPHDPSATQLADAALKRAVYGRGPATKAAHQQRATMRMPPAQAGQRRSQAMPSMRREANSSNMWQSTFDVLYGDQGRRRAAVSNAATARTEARKRVAAAQAATQSREQVRPSQPCIEAELAQMRVDAELEVIDVQLRAARRASATIPPPAGFSSRPDRRFASQQKRRPRPATTDGTNISSSIGGDLRAGVNAVTKQPVSHQLRRPATSEGTYSSDERIPGHGTREGTTLSDESAKLSMTTTQNC